MIEGDQFLHDWRRRAAELLDRALAFLAACAESPLSDEKLREWTRQLAGLPFTRERLPAIIELLHKGDPHLVEAGLDLAAEAASGCPACTGELELPVARTLREVRLDPWVVRAAVRLLGRFVGQVPPRFVEAHRALVAWLEAPAATATASGPAIRRSMFIDPRAEAIELFEQHTLQTLTPTELHEIILPVLERHHATSGWAATLTRILERRGLAAREHLELLERLGIR